MSEYVQGRRLSHKQAQKLLSQCIRRDKWWIRRLEAMSGQRVYPRPHEVYTVRRDGRKFMVVFSDPTM